MRKLKCITFSSTRELLDFVNDYEIKDFQITTHTQMHFLWYYKESKIE